MPAAPIYRQWPVDAAPGRSIGANRHQPKALAWDSVGARAVERRGVGLYGRPPCLAATLTHLLVNRAGLRGRP